MFVVILLLSKLGRGAGLIKRFQTLRPFLHGLMRGFGPLQLGCGTVSQLFVVEIGGGSLALLVLHVAETAVVLVLFVLFEDGVQDLHVLPHLVTLIIVVLFTDGSVHFVDGSAGPSHGVPLVFE